MRYGARIIKGLNLTTGVATSGYVQYSNKSASIYRSSKNKLLTWRLVSTSGSWLTGTFALGSADGYAIGAPKYRRMATLLMSLKLRTRVETWGRARIPVRRSQTRLTEMMISEALTVIVNWLVGLELQASKGLENPQIDRPRIGLQQRNSVDLSRYS